MSRGTGEDSTRQEGYSMQARKVLLTGGCGLVGRTLAPMLRDEFAVTHFEMNDPGDGLPFIQGDLRSAGDVAKACAGMDAVVHIAALHGAAWSKAGDDIGFEVNVIGTKNILEEAVKAGVRRVVFTSSIWATGHDNPSAPYLPIDEKTAREPQELYGLTKILGEQMCRYASAKYGLSTIVLRPGGIRPAESYAPRNAGLLAGCVDVRDVAQSQLLALRAPDTLKHEVFIITADTAEFSGRIAELVGPNAEWYTVEKAKRLLGYRPQYNYTLN
jgi:nucleoside-diphosphate-sugar epimerase